ncbi:MAG: DNA repair protein RecO [Desulfobacteraceae bacterium]|jgi:DNA repair protein RecO (recombination protein O)
MSRLTTKGIVLQRRQYSDFDLIVTMLTADRGKRTLIAKSAKKSAKRFPGILEPFNHLQIVFRETRRKGMPVLEEATLYRPFENLRSDFEKTAYASYWVESISIWLEEGQVEPDVYRLLAFVLDALNAGKMEAAFLSILFQMRFVGHEGLQPVLERCTCCQSPIEQLPQNSFCVDLGQGGVVCNHCPTGTHKHLRLSKGTLKQLLWISTGDLTKASRMRFSSRAMAEATAFMEAFMPYHIGRKPKSLGILQQVRA